MEFDLPQSDDDLLGDGPNDDGLDLDLPDDLGAVNPALARKKAKKADEPDSPSKAPAKKKKSKGPVIAIGGLLLLGAAGAGLHYTPFGAFGRYAIEPYLEGAGDAGAVQRQIDEAESQAMSDTYADVRGSLRTLGDARRGAYLNRELLARSAMHLALFEVRFGDNSNAQAQESQILERLRVRGDDAPGLRLAKAAMAVRANELNDANNLLNGASAADPYVALIRGELELRRGNAEAALAAFEQASAAGARALWGIARAQTMAGNAEAAASATQATLEASPNHAGALIASAKAMSDASAALATVQRITSGSGETLVRASRQERAEAHALAGSIYAQRAQRGPAREEYEAAIEAEPFFVDALLGLGEVQFEDGRFRDSQTTFQAAEEAAEGMVDADGLLPPASRAKLGRARCAIMLEQPQQAGVLMGELQQAHPESPEVLSWLGRSHEELGATDDALAAFERSIELDPSRFESYLALAQFHFGREENDEAAEVLTRASEAVELTATVRYLMGDAALRRGRAQEAIGEFNAALEMEPNNTDALFGLANAQRRLRRLDDATATLDRLASIAPEYPALSIERGRIFEALGNPSRAVRSYRQALEADPENLDLVLRLGAALVATGEYDEAEEYIDRVVRTRVNSPDGEHYLGRIKFGRGDAQEALRHLSRAVQLDPTVAVYHLYEAWAHLETNSFGRAMEAVERALERDPELAEAHLVKGLTHLRGSGFSAALESFRRALELKPGLSLARASSATALDRLGQPRVAIQELARATSEEGDHGDWWYQLGALRIDNGLIGEAGGALERAVTLGDAEDEAPNWLADAHRRLGDVQWRGNRQSAATHYRRYLELAPQGAVDRQAVEDRLRGI